MRDVSRIGAKFMFYLVAVVLLLWTSSLTVTFVAGALPTAFWLVPFLALMVFDGGQVAWLFVFLHYAEGAGQRAIAIGLCLFDFIGVGLMVMAEILLGGQELVAAPESLGTYAIWGIGIWTLTNMGAVIAFHLFDPKTRIQMAIQAEKDAIVDEAFHLATQMRVGSSHQAAQSLAAQMMGRVFNDLALDREAIPTEVQMVPGAETAVPEDQAIGTTNGRLSKATPDASPEPAPLPPPPNGRG